MCRQCPLFMCVLAWKVIYACLRMRRRSHGLRNLVVRLLILFCRKGVLIIAWLLNRLKMILRFVRWRPIVATVEELYGPDPLVKMVVLVRAIYECLIMSTLFITLITCRRFRNFVLRTTPPICTLIMELRLGLVTYVRRNRLQNALNLWNTNVWFAESSVHLRLLGIRSPHLVIVNITSVCLVVVNRIPLRLARELLCKLARRLFNPLEIFLMMIVRLLRLLIARRMFFIELVRLIFVFGDLFRVILLRIIRVRNIRMVPFLLNTLIVRMIIITVVTWMIMNILRDLLC